MFFVRDSGGADFNGAMMVLGNLIKLGFKIGSHLRNLAHNCSPIINKAV
mgnify:CR=1 FL=1